MKGVLLDALFLGLLVGVCMVKYTQSLGLTKQGL